MYKNSFETTDYYDNFFNEGLEKTDKDVFDAVKGEAFRQEDGVELIASENIVSKAVIQASGSVLTNKYAEGYSGRRYYGGCEEVDKVENIANERLKKLFGCKYSNVQPHSGSQANQGVFNALLKPGDVILGLSLSSGGHLTHGSSVNQSGKWFTPYFYDLDKETCLVDMDDVEKKANEHKPKIIIAGGSAYSRPWDFKRFREIADSIGAYLMVDMAHFAGLVAAGLHDSPFPHAHVVTSTTHKTLRGPRGGIILTNDEDVFKKTNSAIFPGIQGGPLMHIITAKAVAFGEALTPEFKKYQKAVIENTKVLSDVLIEGGLSIVSGGTDNHLILVDLRPKKLTGKVVEESLGRANITCNKNGIPFDTEKPMITSGIRLGSPAGTSRGFGVDEFKEIGKLLIEVVDGLVENKDDNSEIENKVKKEIQKLCKDFPLYNKLY